MSDIDYLRTFLAIYRSGSVTKAAQTLHLSQPAATAHLKALEAYVGSSLFERSRRGVTPTPAANELAHAAGPHIDALEELMGLVSTASSTMGDSVVIGGPGELIGEWFLPQLHDLVTNQGIRLRTMFADNQTILDSLRNGSLDMAIATTEHRESGIEVELIGYERLALVATPELRDSIGNLSSGKRGANQLVDVPFVAFDESLPLFDEYWHSVFQSRLDARPTVTANSLRALLLLAHKGVGMTVLPDHMCAKSLDRGDVVRLIDAKKSAELPLYLLWRSGTLRRPQLVALRDRLLEIANLPR